jgi:HemY protein
MRWLLWFMIILGLAIAASLLVEANQGYVLIVRPPYRLEMSLNFLLALIVLAFVLLHLVLRFINYTQRLPATVRAHRETQQLKESHAALLEQLNYGSGRIGPERRKPERRRPNLPTPIDKS